MVAHYLTHTGWAFVAWEPIAGGDCDVDIALTAKDGAPVLFQVKAPDQPGYVVGHHLVDGEYDQRVLEAVAKAARQLPRTGPEAKFIVVCANRTWPLSSNVQCLVVDLVGSTVGHDSVVTLEGSRLGKFWRRDWKHVSGVVVLDYLRGHSDFLYPCTVLLNPVASVPGAPDWFPHARVFVLEDSVFRWVRGEPGDTHTLPDGTMLVP